MPVTRQNLTDRLNAMRAATAANPIKKSDFAQFLEDWLNYMTNDGQYSAGVLEQWKTETLNLQNANLNFNIQRALDAAAQALASAAAASAVATGNELSLPAQRASFALDFVNSRFLDPQIAVSRNSIGTYFDKNGVMRVAPANKPRFNHSLVSKSSLGVLNESKSTNYLLDSYNFASANWMKNRCIIQNGTRKGIFSSSVQRNVCNGEDDPFMVQAINLSANNLVLSNTKGTFSMYVWTDEAQPTKVRLFMYGTNSEGLISKIVDVTNVPTKVEITQTFPANFASTILTIRIDPFEGETTQPAAGRYLNIDCAQFEPLGFSSSYIPTTNAPIVREKDLIIIQGTLYSQYFPNGVEEGTMFCVCDKGYANDSYPSYWSFGGPNTTNGQNTIRLTNLVAPVTGVTAAMYVDGVSYSSFGFEIPIGNVIRSAFAWKKGDAKCYVNGNIASADLNVQVPTNINQLRLEDINGHVKQIMFWPTRLPNVQLQALTTAGLFGVNPNQAPTNGTMFGNAYLSPYAILRSTGRQLFTLDGTGVSQTRLIKFPYDCNFEIVDSGGATLTSLPPTSCGAGTENFLIITLPIGRSLTYAITPIFEY